MERWVFFIPISKILDHSVPYADGYKGFWQTPLSMQHPLAAIEIVPWDSSLTLIFSHDEEIIENFMKAFLLSEDLSVYNIK